MGEHWIIYDEPMVERPALHPRHGVHAPTAGTPARRPGSIRRTATTAMLRPRGINGELVLRGRARDLYTPLTGAPVVVEEASLDARVAFMSERIVREITTSPPLDGIDTLVGVRASAGFRGAAELVAGAHRERRSPLYLLLDDVPVATLVSGYATGYAGVRPVSDGRHHVQHPDLCAGWRTGGTILVDLERTGFSPVVTGPPAPPIVADDDPLGWHELEPVGPNGMRRHRRLDVVAGDPVEIDAFFRDSHMSFEGRETVIHEYTVSATVDPATMCFDDVRAVAGALPFVECIEAVDSPARLRGQPVHGVRRRVREELTGPTTCTHLNDTLRSLEDIEALLPALAGMVSTVS